MAAHGQVARLEVRLAVQLHDPRRHHVDMLLLLIGMLEELGLDRIREDAVDGVVMPLVAQNADDLGRQHLVQHLDHLLAVGGVARGDGAIGDVLPGALLNLLHIGNERLHGEPFLSRKAARLAGGHARDGPSARTLSGLMGKCRIGSPCPLPDEKSA